MRVDSDFKESVYSLVAMIPVGRVMSYGQIAALRGLPWAAREIGQIAHFGPPDLPWHRVVNKQGFLASGYPGGRAAQRTLLEAEDVPVSSDSQVNIKDLLWWPEQK